MDLFFQCLHILINFQNMNKINNGIQLPGWIHLLARLGILTVLSGSALADSSVLEFHYAPAPSKSDLMPAYGFGMYSLKDSGPGLYFNGSISGTPGDSNNYYEGGCYYSCGTLKGTQTGAGVFSAGATFPLVTPDMNVPFYRSVHAYAGLGYGKVSAYSQYYYNRKDYWYDDSSRDKSSLNVNLGVMFGFNGFALNLGANSISKALYIGIGINN